MGRRKGGRGEERGREEEGERQRERKDEGWEERLKKRRKASWFLEAYSISKASTTAPQTFPGPPSSASTVLSHPPASPSPSPTHPSPSEVLPLRLRLPSHPAAGTQRTGLLLPALGRVIVMMDHRSSSTGAMRGCLLLHCRYLHCCVHVTGHFVGHIGSV